MQTTMTITEALAEIKTVNKRLEAKRASVGSYLFRQGNITDPLGPDGGSRKFVAEEQQSIRDLEERVVAIRRAVARANESTELTVAGETRTIAAWLTWRKEVAPARKQHVHSLLAAIRKVRQDAQQKGLTVVAGDSTAASEVIVNLSEKNLAREAEQIEAVLGALDGQLSLKNATATVTV